MIWYINPSKPKRKYAPSRKKRSRAASVGAALRSRSAALTVKRKKNPSKSRKTKPLHGAALAAARLAREAAERSKKMAKKKGKKRSSAKWVLPQRKTRKRRRKLAHKLSSYAKGWGRKRKGKSKRRGVSAYAALVGRRHKRRSHKSAPRRSRKAAARKAAKTRAAKHAARSRAAKKAARTRRRRHGGGRKTVSRRRRKSAARRRTHRTPRRYRRVVALKRAVGTVHRFRRSKRKSKMAKAYYRRHRLGAVRIPNPFKAVLGAVKQAVPFGVGYAVSNVVGTKGMAFLASKVNVGALGQHAPVVGSLASVALLAFATGRGPLAKMRLVKKYRSALLAGAGLNAIFTAVKTYNPGGIAGYLGLGDYAGYAPYTPQGAFPVGTGDYVQVGDYIETGDYVQVGAYEDAAAYEEVGAFTGGFRGDRVKMLAPVPHVSGHVSIPQYPAALPAPAWSDDAEENLYTGIFSGGHGGL